MRKLKTLCEEVKRDAQRGLARKPRDRWDDWQKESNNYLVTLSYKGRSLSVDFWCRMGIKRAPTAYDVLDCLLSDCQAGEMDFYEFCSEFGYDDIHLAHRVWQECVEMAPQLRQFLGDDSDMFMEAER